MPIIENKIIVSRAVSTKMLFNFAQSKDAIVVENIKTTPPIVGVFDFALWLFGAKEYIGWLAFFAFAHLINFGKRYKVSIKEIKKLIPALTVI